MGKAREESEGVVSRGATVLPHATLLTYLRLDGCRLGCCQALFDPTCIPQGFARVTLRFLVGRDSCGVVSVLFT
jgi:hypothetical protein